MASYLLEKFSTWTSKSYRFKPNGGLTEKYNLDDLLTNVMLYWTNDAITSSMRYYAENMANEEADLIMG